MNAKRLSIIVLVFLGFITRMFAVDPKPEISGDYLLLQGRWTVLRNEIRKQATPGMHGRLFIFEAKTFRIDTDRGSEGFSIDETTKPKSIDFDDGRSPVIRGIYQIDGEALIICTGAPGAKRPKKFKTSIWSGTVLTALERAK